MPAEAYSAPDDSQTVMLSRSFSEFEEHRAALTVVLQTSGIKVAMLSHHELTTAGVIRTSLGLVQHSAALAIIIGPEYGYVPLDEKYNPDKLSIAELEFNEAVRLGRPVLAFREAGDVSRRRPQTERKVEGFLSRVETITPIHSFLTLEEFRVLLPQAVAMLSDRLKFQAERFNNQTVTPPSSSSRSADEVLNRQRDLIPGDKPLVFISASHKDSEWRKLLEEALAQHHEVIDWWGDSRITLGSDWAAEIEAAMARAQIAVPLISPDYLNSANAVTEMIQLRNESRKGSLKLLPVVVRESNWQIVEAIRTIEVWAKGRPLDLLGPAERRDEMNRIAASILELLEIRPRLAAEPRSTKGVAPNVDSSALHFSDDARIVIQKARALADRSERGRITSSCLLFGFAESAYPERNDCSHLVRNMMVATGNYESALKAFLDGAENSLSVEFVESVGRTSRNVKAVLEHARRFAIRVTGGSDTIHQRHLLAALLSPPGRKGQFNAHKRLKEIGIDRPRYLAELLDFIRASDFQEDLDEWQTILSGARQPKSSTKAEPNAKIKVDVTPFVEGPAGYTAEFVGVGGERAVADYLFVGTHADRLAELIALRETKLPLAIGLFGNWGSGKSHFMNLIDRRLKGLMDIEKERAANASPKWCREIVPIYFNAWHYLDANLWASLVAQIFESLFAHLSPRGKDLEQVQAMLEQASGATARAAEELAIAESATKQAQKELATARETRVKAETFVNGVLRGLRSLLPDVTPEKVQREAAKLLGIEKEIKTLDDLRDVAREANSLSARTEGIFKNLWKQPGRAWRMAWLLTVVGGGALIAAIVVWYLPGLKDRLAPTGRALATILGAISAFGLWLRPLMAAAGKRLTQIEDWTRKAESEQQRLRETKEVQQAAQKVTVATAKEEAAKLQLAEAQTRESQLKEEAENLAPGRRLGRYIEQRAQSADYRGQLGLVSLARRDFQELSNLFADAEALKDRIAQLRNSAEPEGEKEAAKIEELSRSIDRIVLFVDDLDRCQPEKIVEILQAVHLLLAFPLFAVVVGVDQRALRQSLRMQFKGLLTGDSQSEGLKIEANERMATPLDYLEKIFHVPFHLPAMGEEGFAELISKLTEPPKAEPPKAQIEDVTLQIPQVQEIATEPGSMPAPVTPQATTRGEPTKSPQHPSAAQIQPEQAGVERIAERVAAEMVGSVPLSEWERKALREYHALIQTPRAAKRLLNTYRLVRAGIPKEEWADFAAGEYRIAMLLLAAAAGYPATAREWFSKLSTSNPEKVLEDKSFLSLDPAAWAQFKNVHKATFSNEIPKLAPENTIKWIRRVEAFTF